MEGEKIVPSVTRFFTQQQTLYVFFQAYYPEKTDKADAFDPNTLRAGLVFFRGGVQVNATPLLAPTAVDREDAHGFLPHQPAAREIAFGTLYRAGRRDRRWHAAIRFWPRLPRARAGAYVAESHRRAAGRAQCAPASVPCVAVVRN